MKSTNNSTNAAGSAKATKVFSRRDFLKSTVAAGGLLILPAGFLRGENAPSNRIGYAAIGVGGMGGADTGGISKQKGVQLVGLCDVDANTLRKAKHGYLGRFPDAKDYVDYREMLRDLGDKIDAVSVSTPDHTHFTAAYTAADLGKHIYVQKPLCHTVDQVRRLAAKVKEKGVVSQMGNQGSSSPHIRTAREWYEAGVLGDVPAVDAWSDRPIWPQGQADYKPAKKAPAHLAWPLWLGPAPKMEYRDGLHTFSWRGYYEFGCGALGDMAIHLMYDAFYALRLTAPEKIEVELFGTSPSKVAFPNKSRVVFHFPAANGRGPVKFTWNDGKGSNQRQGVAGLGGNGSILRGSKVTLGVCGWASDFSPRVTAEERKAINAKVEKKYKRVAAGGHYANFIRGIRGEEELSSSFDIAGPFAEVIILGCMAQRLGRTLNWDSKKGVFVGDDEANALIKAPAPTEGFYA